ncbi:ATP-dependent endonuclease [Rhodobacter sp. 24-YEA-8]|uniref:ATP-dependent nuclease n=1 Tax=Rhodobacter sp. 24-YEA-8 TaxID=1884310 RepID=UPI000896E96C|nr:AAA family ATPase [Rhodobacter sp. 24-YEA-8]SED17594.1 Predicted ATP-dependent endonuclease of the OLD family, contains P-loop ATPase and TOPRIM domains [Rhodobacter sp. 24-YEA-8]
MHHISELKIQGFKSIASATFPLSHYTPLVGYNNAGKTNILRAASWVMKKASLSAEDFNDVNTPVTVEAEISGITAAVLDALDAAHRARIEPLVVDGKIKIRRSQATPGQSAASIRFEVEKEQDGAMAWVVNPTGIDAAIGVLFPDPILIGAMENATEDVAKFGSGTTIGKLLKEIMGPVIERHSPAVAAALDAVGRQLSANSAEKDETLTALDASIQGELARLFPGVTAKTHVPVPDFADFMKSATIRIFEEGFDHPDGRDASSFGHGAQRSIQIALIKCLAEVKRAAGGNVGRTTLLLIDEPELYLHPQAIEVVRAALNRLAGEGYQIIITTHSANMIARSDAKNSLLIRRSVEHGTTCLPRMKDVVEQAIAEADHQSEALFALSNSSKVLFSERVVITEGKTERMILPAVFENLFGLTPGEDKIGVVDIGGVHNIPDTMRILCAMGLPCKAIVDLDFVFRTAPAKALIAADHPAIVECKAILARLAASGAVGLDASGLPTKHAGNPAIVAFELLALEVDAAPHIDALFIEMQEHGIWLWKKGAIEAYLNIAKTDAARMTFIDRLNEEAYRAALPDYPAISDAMAWLRV